MEQTGKSDTAVDTQLVHWRVDRDIYDRVVAYSERTRRSKNAAALVILEAGLDALEGDPR